MAIELLLKLSHTNPYNNFSVKMKALRTYDCLVLNDFKNLGSGSAIKGSQHTYD